jgi:hypothetical protein
MTAKACCQGSKVCVSFFRLLVTTVIKDGMEHHTVALLHFFKHLKGSQSPKLTNAFQLEQGIYKAQCIIMQQH